MTDKAGHGLTCAASREARPTICVSCGHDRANQGTEQQCKCVSALLVGNECNSNCTPRKIIFLQIFILRLWSRRTLDWTTYDRDGKREQNSGKEYLKR